MTATYEDIYRDVSEPLGFLGRGWEEQRRREGAISLVRGYQVDEPRGVPTQSEAAKSTPSDRSGLGFRILAVALAAYAASAAVASISAGLFVLALQAYYRRDPVTGPLNLAGGIASVIGLALGLASFIVLVWAVSRITRETRSAGRETNRAIARMRRGLTVAYVLLVPSALLGVIAFFGKGGEKLLPAFIGVATAAAFAFLTSLVLAARKLGGKSRAGFVWTVAIVGSIGILGETIASLIFFGPPATVDWITFGGLPLVNWNAPFGLMVAASSVLLAYVFLGVAADFTRGPSPGYGAPSPDPSP